MSGAPPPSAPASAPAWQSWKSAVLVLLTVVFLVEAFLLARDKFFSIDEFEYSHAAWLVSRGLVPYRDFFEHHFPLVFELLSGVFRSGFRLSADVAILRLALFPFLLVTLGSAALLNRDLGAGVTPLLFLSSASFLSSAVEIRPDPVAFSFFVASLAVLRLPRVRSRVCGAAAGILLALAIWSSQKVLVYGAVVGAALLLDLLRVVRKFPRPTVVAAPFAFLAGFGAVAAAIAIILLGTGSASGWFAWCVRWPIEHERRYPGFPWTRYFVPFLRDSWWLVALALAGLSTTIRRIVARESPSRGADVVLCGALATSFLSFSAQKAAYPYSLVPFIGMMLLFAGRGIGAIADMLRRAVSTRAARGGAAVTASILAVVALATSHRELEGLRGRDNRYQLSVLRRLDALTSPADPVYDNSGSAVARPSVSYFFFTSAFLREQRWNQLSSEVPTAILSSGCPAMLRDLRFDSLPPVLKTFLVSNFQPYSGDLWLWGRRYRKDPGADLDEEFFAIRSAGYFVEPPGAMAGDELRIDGTPIRTPVFDLSQGPHRLSYRGGLPEIYVLWLPRDGRRYLPQPGSPPRFSILF